MSDKTSSQSKPKESQASEKSRPKSGSEDRKYSEGTQMLQQMERGFTRATYRLAHGFSEGIRTYYEESEKSAQKKEDGAVRDFLRNSAAGFSNAMEEMSKAPYEIAKATDSDAAWDFARSINKGISRAFEREEKDDEKKEGKDKGDPGNRD